MPLTSWKEYENIFVFSLGSDHASIDMFIFGHANNSHQWGLSTCLKLVVCAFGITSPKGSCVRIGLRTYKAGKT